MTRWRAVELIEEKVRSMKKDVLIDTLRNRIKILEAGIKKDSTSYNNELAAERAKTKVQSELVTFESSLKESARNDAKTYRRQRNLALIGLGISLVGGTAVVLKPP
jgi:hypothetical protein